MTHFKTYQLALTFYRNCERISIGNRIIRAQFQRASLSIVLNIAEGHGRITEKDRRRFFSIAFASLRETLCLLELLQEQKLLTESDPLAGCLYRLIQRPGSLIG